MAIKKADYHTIIAEGGKADQRLRLKKPKTLQEQATNFNNSYREFGMSYRPVCTEVNGQLEGTMELTTYAHLPCGCRSTGNGTLQFPFTVKPCEKHQ
jgi:hypothetical protein